MSSIALEKKETNLNLADEIDNKLADLSLTEPKALDTTKSSFSTNNESLKKAPHDNLVNHLVETSSHYHHYQQQQQQMIAATSPYTEQYKQMLSTSSVVSPASLPQQQQQQQQQPLNFSEDQTKLELQKQLEYYFSSKNLLNDKYLRSHMDDDDYVAISLIAQFKRIKQLTSDINLIISTIRQSSQLVLDPTCAKVRSIGRSAGGSITINTNFSKKPSKTYILNTDPQLAQQQQQARCVLILREVASEASVEQIKELFSHKEPHCAPCVQCESAGNDSWYVTFNNEDEAQKALQYLKGDVQTFMDKPIRARIKTHTTIPRSTSSMLTNKTNTAVSPPSASSPQAQTPTSLNTPTAANAQIISYETPPPSSSSYMSTTSSPSPAATMSSIYSSAARGATPNQDLNQAISYHDVGLQLIVQQQQQQQQQKAEYDNQSNAGFVSQSNQPISNYIAFNSQTNLKYFPNAKLGLIQNQPYLFPPNTSSPNAVTSPASSRTLVFPNQAPPPAWHQMGNYSRSANYKFNSNNNQLLEEQLSSPSPSVTKLEPNDEIKSNENKNYASPLNLNELANSSSEAAAAASNLVIYSNQQPILQIPNYYQQPPHQLHQQQQQLPLNNYNRSSPAAATTTMPPAFYQSLSSQSPSSQQQQHYLPLLPGPTNGQQTLPNVSQQASLLSSASNSSLNSNNPTSSTSHQIPSFTNLPGGVYQQPPPQQSGQFIIQNPQFLNHPTNQSAQIQIINSNSHMISSYPVVASNNNNNNSTNSNKSSTPTPLGTASNSSQITSPSVYNPSQFFIATNLQANGASTASSATVNPVALSAYFQYYQNYNNNNNNPGVAQQQQQQQQQTQHFNLANQPQFNHHNILQPPVYAVSNQPSQQHQQQPVYHYELIQSQFDAQQNMPNTASYQPTLLQSQSQINLASATASSSSSNESTKSTQPTSEPSTNTNNNNNNANNSVTQTPLPFGIVQQGSHPHHVNSHSNQPSTLFVYNPQNAPQMILNPINTSATTTSASASQLLMTTLANNNSSPTTSQSAQVAHHHHHHHHHHVTNAHHQLNLNGQTSANSAILTHQTPNSTQRRANSGNNSSNTTPSDSRNLSFNNSNNTHAHNNAHHQASNHRNYNTNTRNKHFNNYSNNNNEANSSNHHNQSQAMSQKNLTTNTNVTDSSATPVSSTQNDNAKPAEETQIDEKSTNKSPPNNTDLTSFPPLLNSANIPVKSSTTTNTNSTATTTASSIPASEQSELDPAIICINSTIPPNFSSTTQTSSVPPAQAPTTNSNSTLNKYVKSANLNKILMPLQSSQDQRASSDWEYSSVHSSKQHSANEINNAITNLTNQANFLTNMKHHVNLKHYDIIKSHLGFNNNNNANNNNTTNSNYSQQQQKQANTQQGQNTPQTSQVYTNSNSGNYKSGASNYNSRKSIEGINSQRMHSHHGMNQASLSNKFYNNVANNERSSSSTSINKNTNQNRQNFSTNQQMIVDNKNPVISSLKNENNNNVQHMSSPSFNRKQKSNNQSYHNNHNKNNNLHLNSKEANLKSQAEGSNQKSQTQSNQASLSLNEQNTSLMLSSSSSSQANDEDTNSLNSNSWNNKKLTFAEIVQQKSASNNQTSNETTNATTNVSSSNSNKPNTQNTQLVLNQAQESSNGCSPNVSSSASATSATSSQATTPTLQTQSSSPFVSLRVANTSFTDSDQSANDQHSENKSSNALNCYALNQTESTSITNSSIQV